VQFLGEPVQFLGEFVRHGTSDVVGQPSPRAPARTGTRAKELYPNNTEW